MKRKIYITITMVLLIIVICVPAAFAVQDSDSAQTATPKVTNEVKLTDTQKNELKQLSDKMFETKKQMVQKYLDYGIITKEQADKKFKKIEEIQKYKEKNGYMPMHGKGKPGKCKKRDNLKQDSQ